MSTKLEDLLIASRSRPVSENQLEAQRRSFAFGNTHFENEQITRETINRAADALKHDKTNRHPER